MIELKNAFRVEQDKVWMECANSEKKFFSAFFCFSFFYLLSILFAVVINRLSASPLKGLCRNTHHQAFSLVSDLWNPPPSPPPRGKKCENVGKI